MLIEKLKDNSTNAIFNKINEIIEAINKQPKPLLIIRYPMFLLEKSRLSELRERLDEYNILYIGTDGDAISFELISTRELTDEDRLLIESKLEEINRSL